MSAPIIGSASLPQRARGYWKAGPAAAGEWLERKLEAERAQLPPWLVVGLGGGIAAWFALPDANHWASTLFLSSSVAVAGLVFARGRVGKALGWLGLMAALGMALMWWRATSVAAPRLDRPTIATFAGTVEKAEAIAAREQYRLTLATDDAALPPRVRVSIPLEDAVPGLVAGAQVRLRARLAPPPPMAIPGTYDFARDAWFKRIGGVGKALGPVELVSPGNPRGFGWARDRLRAHIEQALPPSSRGIAVALVTGDQNAVGVEDAEAMRRSGLTHLLSVSGLHIAVVVAFAMLLTLKLMALSRTLALGTNPMLAAAAVAAAAGIGYTLLTGAQVPTVRSCIAALLVLGGIALGRDALSLRLIAAGAVAVLLVWPESLAGPSFQMSFGAVTAIVALHSAPWARRWFGPREEGWGMRALRGLGSVAATGIAVEMALTPLALFHFHRSGLYGVAANIVAIPLTTFVIMPLEALALLLDTIGLGAPLWWLTGASVDFLLGLAHWVSGAKGAVATLPSMPGWAFAAMAMGGLWLCLWETRWRRWGLLPVAIGLIGALAAPRPDLLVTGDGRYLAIVGDGGQPMLLRSRSGFYFRALLSEASGFDGDGQALDGTAVGDCSPDACVATIDRGGRRWTLLATRSPHFLDWREMIDACAASDIVVSDRRLPDGCTPRWLKLDRATLAETGGLAIRLGEAPRVDTVAQRNGARPWATHGPLPPRRPRPTPQ